MNGRDKLIERLIKEEGGTREQYLSLLNKIAYHESGHTMDPSIKQIGGGPGRGKYQFEAGKDAGGITAARRTKQYLNKIGEEVPKWLEKAAEGNDLDASQLSSEQQDILFLGNMKMHPKADLEKVFKGEEDVTDFWAKYHWAGNDRDKKDRVKSFKSSLEAYNQGKSKGTDNTRLASSSQEADVQPLYSPQVQQQVQPVQDNIQPPPQQRGQLRTQPQEQLAQAPQVGPKPQEQAQQELFNTQIGSNIFEFVKNRSQRDQGQLTSFDTGGSHQQNPHGGIPQGQGQNGQPNTVEEGETKFNDFVFSDRIFTDGKVATSAKQRDYSTMFAFGGKLKGGDTIDPPTEKKNPIDEKLKQIQDYNNPGTLYPDTGTPIVEDWKERKKYYNPKVEDNITSGDKKLDLLYKNDWLLDVPILGDKIKDKAKEYAKKSQGSGIVDREYIDTNNKETNYDGTDFDAQGLYKDRTPLVDQYFSKDAKLPYSKYKPKSDYLEFLPSYSVKGDFDKLYKEGKIDSEVFKMGIDELVDEDFFKNKTTKTQSAHDGSYLSKVLEVDLGGHKVGAAWDEETGLPYISVSDAWDFAPEHYSTKWKKDTMGDTKQDLEKNRQTSKIQSHLMHKAGNPFKIYDRFYFDPETKEYIPDPKQHKNKKK